MSRILRLSLRSFCSSSVSNEPSSTIEPGHRQHVEGDRLDELRRRRELDRRAVVGELGRTVDDLADLLVEFVDTGQPASGHGLVGRDDQAGEAGLVVERLHHRHERHRRAVRVGDDALRRVGGQVAVDLGDDQRDVGVHPERRGVVDHDRARHGELRGERSRGGGAGGEQGDVEPARVGGLGVLDDDVGALPRQGGSRRAGRREVPHLADREVTFVEQSAHARCRPDPLLRRHRLEVLQT